jgi:sialic acid synthase SpsE
MKTFIIAEAGSNHDKDLNQAFKLVDAAKSAGADAVKFQIFSSNTLYAKDTPNFGGYTNINELMASLELPREWVKTIKDYCDKKDIEFMATPFDEEAVQQLCDLEVKKLKIAGFESTDLRFVELVASTGLPLIISAGIGCSLSFIEKIIDVCHKQKNYDITMLHCNNAYPTPQEDINLGTIKNIYDTYKNRGLKVGLSDHTLSTLTPSLAVSIGASVIEKHFTISKKLPGPDHAFAMEPDELKQMCEYIRLAEVSFATKEGIYTSSEEHFKFARRSVVSKTFIAKGEVFSEENTTTSRPFLENAVAAEKYHSIIGKIATRDIEARNTIREDDLK